MLAYLLRAHGVKNAVVSPGSRNAPLLAAMQGSGLFNLTSVIDERSAAFIALGMAESSGEPVALVCTSGTALLNYSPAVAEAYYRRLPLVVVSADRPAQWIDQDDSQTLNQPGALGNFVKATVDIPAESDLTPDGPWLANRLINHALIEATATPCGPVHINVRLDMAGRKVPETPFLKRVITMEQPKQQLTKPEMNRLAERLEGKKLMVIAGFMQPDHKLNRALTRLAALPNVAVLTETISNLHGSAFLSHIDTVMPPLTEVTEAMTPDVVLTVGGALVSRRVKEWVRSLTTVEHWSVGPQHTTVDPFRLLTVRVEMEASQFIGQLATSLAPRHRPSEFAKLWAAADKAAWARMSSKIGEMPWCDFAALHQIAAAVTRQADIVSGNGTVIRYLQLLDCSRIHRMDCNRGVSGIDGQTSTAIGHALASSERPVWLITGDTAAAYDSGVLLHAPLPANFRMVVMDNGGGAIFRYIKATSAYPTDLLEQRLVCNPGVDWEAVARAGRLKCLTAENRQQLAEALRLMNAEVGPWLLAVKTDPILSTEILKQTINAKN